MPELSYKGKGMPESPIRKLVPFSEEAISKGKTVYHLNIGQPDIKTPEQAMDEVRASQLSVLEYSHSAGFPSLREGFAQYYQKNGIQVEQDNIIVATGGSEALMFAFGSIMDAEDEIIIPEPFYANYNGFAIASGVKVIPVKSTIAESFSLPPIEEFEKLITPKTKAILICNPGNPTGYLYSKEELEVLKGIVLKHDLFLIADEVYREFVYDGNKHTSILTLDGLEENAIVIDSISKRYSMCGARIGMLVSRNRLVMATALKFAQARLSPPTLAQIAALGALKTPDSYFEEVITEYTERRNLLVEGLNKIPGVFCPTPKGAFYCVAEFPVDDTDRFAQWLLQSFDLNSETVMIAPAAGFYAQSELGMRQARLAYVLNREALTKCLKILTAALEVYPGRIN
ncbi:MAG: pyridoxal phosphate-dependent aminotransferase [Bacteroidota bacterium]|nr:pyridoxal phosphate-dependent aminotransferase [Bacteroidota bacterium]MDX5504569.1 pyridoxal phosphate-dependent aminotransferase [Bacteroidota bacterium]